MLVTTTPLEYLSDAAWHDIARKSSLPNEARSKIYEAIYVYRAWYQAESLKSPADTRADLDNLASTFGRAIEELSAVLSNPRGTVLLITAMQAPTDGKLAHESVQHQLKGWISEIGEMQTIALRAKKSVVPGVKGAWEQARVLTMFVYQLDKVLFEFTGKHVTRSSKGRSNSRDYVKAVCRIADSEISAGSIDQAMKTIIKARGGKRPKTAR